MMRQMRGELSKRKVSACAACGTVTACHMLHSICYRIAVGQLSLAFFFGAWFLYNGSKPVPDWKLKHPHKALHTEAATTTTQMFEHM